MSEQLNVPHVSDVSEQKSEPLFVITKENIWKISTVVLALLLVVFVARSYVSSPTAAVVAPSPSVPDVQTAPSAPVKLSIGSAPVIGNENAPVTIVEFSDFSCPYCAAASGDNPQIVASAKQSFGPSWEPIVSNVMKDYVDTGKVRFAVKYTKGHSGGNPAQSVAWCLNDQKLYWKFYPEAFAKQSDVEDLSKMKDLAKSLGADMNLLETCLSSKKYDAKFDSDSNEGIKAGVQGTPAFFINGKLVSGAVPYAQVKKLIDAELSAS